MQHKRIPLWSNDARRLAGAEKPRLGIAFPAVPCELRGGEV
jgi:hypothetical protein